jgi:hypothetical protein
MAMVLCEMTCEFHSCFCESALVQTCEVVVFAEDTKNGLEMLSVKGCVLGEDEDVVEEYHDEVIEVWPEHVLHGTLKGGRCVGEAERHDFELVVSVACPESCLGYVRFRHSDLLVA